MNVPNHEKKAFRDMTPEERSAIVEAKLQGNVDFLSDSTWKNSYLIYINFDEVYRTRPRQLVIPWEVIRPEYKWAAMDESGSVCFFCGEPLFRSGDGVWENGSDWCMSPLAIDTPASTRASL